MRKFKTKLVAILVAITFAATSVSAQTLTQGHGPGDNVRRRGERRPGIMVQAGIARHQVGPEITRPEPQHPNYRVNLLNEFLRNLFPQLTVLIQLLPDLIEAGPGTSPPGGGGGGGIDQIVMTEIAHDGNVVFVELLNLSALETRLDGFRFADGTGVSPSLPPIELDRNASIVVQLGGDTQDDLADALLGFRVQSIVSGELALYNFSDVAGGLLPIEDPDFMVDYVQWNPANDDRDPPLESIAAAANLWTRIDAIRASLANMSFRLAANAESRMSTSSGDFDSVEFSENTLGVPESQLADVR